MNETAIRRSEAASQGQMVVLTMVGLALAAAAFAWWWNYTSGQRAMELLGPEAATLIRTAADVEILAERTGNVKIGAARGLLNARTALLSDASYDWSSPARFATAEAAVRFSRQGQEVTVFFDFEHHSIQVSGTWRTATLKRKTAEGWRTYIARQRQDAGRKSGEATP